MLMHSVHTTRFSIKAWLEGTLWEELATTTVNEVFELYLVQELLAKGPEI